MSSITIIDSICGSGKTSYAIQMMNNNMDNKYIFVTPFLEEIKRIKESTFINFYEPEQKYGQGKKMNHLKELVSEGHNIVMTHELFSRIDDDTLIDIKNEGYILIMDEVANVLNVVQNMKVDDIRVMIASNLIKIEEDGQIKWLDPLYDGDKFNDIKILSMKNNLFLHNGNVIFWTMPVENFKSFKEIYILTYLFEGQIQKYYYDLHNLEYEIKAVKFDKEKNIYQLINYDKKKEPRDKIGKLIKVYTDYQNGKSRSELNSNYLSKTNNPEKALSKSWYLNADEKQIDQLRKNLVSIFRTQCPTPNKELFWTTFKDFAKDLSNVKCKINKKDDRTKDNFVPFNTRATNDYKDRTATAFLINRFMNPNEKQFFSYRGIEVDEDLLALSDLVQFLFRGSIRKDEEMYCYIPSKRMRDLLEKWLNFEL